MKFYTFGLDWGIKVYTATFWLKSTINGASVKLNENLNLTSPNDGLKFDTQLCSSNNEPFDSVPNLA